MKWGPYTVLIATSTMLQPTQPVTLSPIRVVFGEGLDFVLVLNQRARMSPTDVRKPAAPCSSTIAPGLRLRGRGALSNGSGRFEAGAREVFDDGWDSPPEPRAVPTEVRRERPRSAITRNTSPDLEFDRSINPYRGCEHGCIYCFARPSHAFLGLSPGLDFETRLIARPGIAEVLAAELRAKKYSAAPIAIGTNTDPYQPIEAQHKLMRQILEVLAEFRHPVQITTKGTLIERDIDILAAMARQGLVRVGISLITLDDAVSRALEPRVPRPSRRLATIRALSDAGIPVRVHVSPVIPALTDHETEAILAAAAGAGAAAASSINLRLPREVAGLFREFVQQRFPDRAARIMGRVRELHGGRDYDPEFGTRMTGQGIWADLQRQRFQIALRRLGMRDGWPELRSDLFCPPPRTGDQLSLF